MAEVNEPTKSPNNQAEPVTVKNPVKGKSFPYANSVGRISDYGYYTRLFMGNHFDAFNLKIDSDKYNKAYAKLRYLCTNFAGLLSKIVADMLFSEPIQIKVEGGDQEFVDALVRENKLDSQFYESALSNSYLGDALFKLRVGKRQEIDEKSTVIIEDITPKIWYPELDPFNVRAEPKRQELSWVFEREDKKYLRREIHEGKTIRNELWLMKGDQIEVEAPLELLEVYGLKPEETMEIDDTLIKHAPNWKTTDRFFGISDYYDLDSLFYALNNRMSSIDNILDKHSDPILMVPPGVLDEKGNVRKKALGVIEIGEGDNGKPEYIVWDASLENAFKEIEKIVEFLYLIGEISPDMLGLGEGISASGRALKFKLMRTIAKVARKKLYYDSMIKETIYTAQLLAKAYNLEVDGLKLKKEPVKPEIIWQDGLPVDETEQLQNETTAIDAGITSEVDAAMRVYGYDEQTAESKIKKIKDDKKIDMPATNFGGNPFVDNTNNPNNKNKPNGGPFGKGTPPKPAPKTPAAK